MTTNELHDVHTKAEAALRAAEADKGASPVLVAVIREFAAKATKALDVADDRAWEVVVEVEQAGDSAKAAAEADAGAAEATTSSVQTAHLAICLLKAGLARTAT